VGVGPVRVLRHAEAPPAVAGAGEGDAPAPRRVRVVMRREDKKGGTGKSPPPFFALSVFPSPLFSRLLSPSPLLPFSQAPSCCSTWHSRASARPGA
jgi:hypothetical protein